MKLDYFKSKFTEINKWLSMTDHLYLLLDLLTK